MNVAPSFRSFIQVSEPYEIGGKAYIKMQNPKTGTIRQCRCYNDREYAKLYPPVEQPQERLRSRKDVLGFEKGYITIFKDVPEEYEEYFKLSAARYCKYWGWYFSSNSELPSDLPSELEPARLLWTQIAIDDDTLRKESAIFAAVDSVRYEPSTSEFQGNIGDRVTITAILLKDCKFDTQWGTSHLYTFEDSNGNIYVWKTTSKQLESGKTFNFRGTIKEHSLYRGTKQTILTRCSSFAALPSN